MRRIIYTCLFLPFFLNAQTTLPTVWNFSNPTIENPPTGWITGLGTNGNLTYSGSQNSIGGDNISCRLDATGEFLTIFFAEKAGSLSYWLKGTGIAPNPAFTGVFKIQESVNGTSWTDLREFTTSSPLTSTMTRYVSQPSATARYVRFFYTTKESGTNVALDSVLLRQAPPCTCPVIAVKYNNVQQADGATLITGTQQTLNFLLENKGSIDMMTVDSIEFVGDAAIDFSVTQKPTTINANSNGNLQVSFSAADNGSRIALMRIYTNDPDKNPFTIRLYAIGGTLATEPVQQATTFLAQDIRTYGLTLSYRHPSTRPEQYIILRKANSAITESPVDGTTYQRGDYIGNAQVLFIGTDTIAIKPTFIHANSTYHFKIFSFNGPAGFENYLTNNAPASSVTTTGKNVGNYYAGINSTASNFVTTLSNKIAAHDTVFYSQYIPRFLNPFITRDTTQGRKVVSCVYTGLQHVYNEPFLWWTGTNSGTLTREHTYAQSWMPTRNQFGGWPNDNNGRELTEYNDLHNLFPANQVSGNAVRSNLPFGEIVGTPTYVSPTGLGKKGLNASGVEVWEPRDEQKGDLARALFYMCAAYNGLRSNTWTLPTNQDQAVLKKWHFQDLPDNWEIARHEFIASLQNNRNPFVDSVNFVCRINFSNMTWIANPGTCGISEPLIQIQEPMLGTIWTVQNTQNLVKWSSNNIDSVIIDLYVNDTMYVNLGKALSSNGSFETVGANLPVSNQAKVKLTATNHNYSVVSPEFLIQNLGSVNDVRNQLNIAVYPNPSNGTIQVVSPRAAISKLTITDITGKRIMSCENCDEISIQEKGIFFVEVVTEKGISIQKIMMQ